MKTIFSSLLRETGLTNVEAAELYGVNISTIKRWKNGEIKAKKRTLMILENLIKNK